jgi:hypothetical protein
MIVENNEFSRDFSANSASSINCFESFVKQHPEWNSPNSFVVFRDHPSLAHKKHSYVERFQSSGLCYMHAPVVLQHYLVTMNSDEHIPMLDMAAFMRRNMDSKALERHIWDDEGGDSLVFLLNILETKRKTLISTVSADFNNIPEHFLKYGPALIQGFQVYRDFHSSNWQHLGNSSSDQEFIGRHAMILVGYRYSNNRIRYLLQNWWKMKPFVEVDQSYLELSSAIIHFVKSPQSKMGEFSSNFYDHVECELLDSPEHFAPNLEMK